MTQPVGTAEQVGEADRVGIVVVSHSRPLARAVVALAGEMAPGVTVAIAAGLDEETLGTDAVAISEAIASVDGEAGVLVLMDLGSAVLSAELALEFVEVPDRVLLCSAPLVEGLVAAVVTAASGATRAEVAAEARNGLAGKQSQLGDHGRPPDDASVSPAAANPPASFTVTPAHGLHARPAARLVTLLRDLDAVVEIRNATTGSAWVPATSLSRVATLGLLNGHEMQARASGPQAGDALAAIGALAARTFDETTEDVAPPVVPGGPMPASPGIAIGSVRRPTASPGLEAPGLHDVLTQTPELEKRALTAALETVRARITALKSRVAATEAEIFDAHLTLLGDPALLDEASARVDDGASAALAWATAARETARQFEGLTDPYLAARATDVRAVGEQVLAELLPAEPAATGRTPRAGGAGTILVVADLTPAQAAELDSGTTHGVVTAFGSPTGHAAILTRARGVPAVVAAGAAVLDLPEGTVVALDGSTGELVIDPGTAVQQAFRSRDRERRQATETALRHTHSPAVTRDGVRILVAANASTPAEATAARARGADLIGLVRTEFLFLGRDTAPDLDEQEAAYLDLADAFGGERITLRTLDVGGDKPLGYLPMPAEANPFLGVRGCGSGCAAVTC
ncbi:hypothetical protein JCM9957A_13190 [Kineosporia succinea]